eukprot:369379-Rhodomonas_salina.1
MPATYESEQAEAGKRDHQVTEGLRLVPCRSVRGEVIVGEGAAHVTQHRVLVGELAVRGDAARGRCAHRSVEHALCWGPEQQQHKRLTVSIRNSQHIKWQFVRYSHLLSSDRSRCSETVQANEQANPRDEAQG